LCGPLDGDGYRMAGAGQTFDGMSCFTANGSRAGREISRPARADLVSAPGQGLMSTTWGSWSLVWLANSEFTCTTWYVYFLMPLLTRMWSRTSETPS
jgi:hypothetical protein